MNRKNFTGWNAFRVLLFGQAISLLGTGMTRFAVLVWAYERTGTAMSLALLGFFANITYVLASPLAGVLADRWDRKKVMFLADLGAGSMTGLLLVMNLLGRLEIWHLYLAEGLAGAFEAFQEPAFSASVSQLIPKDSYTRANGMLGLGRSSARVFAPALAGVLQQAAGLNLVMLLDLLTLGLAVTGLLFIRVPAAAASAEGRRAAGSFWKQARFGFGYIYRQPGLRGLLASFFMVNFFGALTYFAVLSSMILARTGGDEFALGVVRTVMGVGGIAGGLLVSSWRGSYRLARTYLLSTALSFLICDFLTATSRSVIGWSVAGFLSELSIAFIVSPYYALWQEKVPGDVQGRVFASREMVQVASVPFGYLVGGLLADRLFEPAMTSGSLLSGALASLVGSGAGAGMAAMFLCTSLLGGLTGLMGLLSPSIRKLDEQAHPPVDHPATAAGTDYEGAA